MLCSFFGFLVFSFLCSYNQRLGEVTFSQNLHISHICVHKNGQKVTLLRTGLILEKFARLTLSFIIGFFI